MLILAPTQVNYAQFIYMLLIIIIQITVHHYFGHVTTITNSVTMSMVYGNMMK